MSGSASPVLRLRSRLGGLRRRIRTLLFAQGFARWLAAAVALLALFFLADWLLDLPLGVRRFVRFGLLDRPDGLAFASWIVMLGATAFLTLWSSRRDLGAAPVFAFALGGIGGVLIWLGVRLLRPVGLRLPDEELALTVEQRFQNLNDRLAAALDFEEELAHPTRGESEAMMRVVLDEAARETEGLHFVRAVSARHALAWAGGALAAVLFAAGIAAVAPATVGLWARRSLLLEDERWPRATTIVAVDLGTDGRSAEHDPAVPFEVQIGRPLLVRALAQGSVPDEVLLLDRVEGARPLPRRMFSVPDTEGLFQLEIRDVRRPFDFVLRGGDDTDEEPVYHVAITVPPRVLSLQASLTYPAYLGRDAESMEGGNLQVPEGTNVEIAFETDVPVTEARALLLDAFVDTRAASDDGRHFAFAFEATRTMRYRILLETEAGRESDPAADTYEIRVVPDRPPSVTWSYPRGALERTPKGRVPLLATAADDHGVQDLVLQIRFGDGEPRSIALLPADEEATEDEGGREERPANDGPYGRTEVATYVPLEIADLRDGDDRAPVAPARLAMRFLATDSRGQTKDGPWAPLDIFAPVDLERDLASRRSGVRSEVATVLAEQRVRREALAGLVGVPLGDAEKDLLKSIQFAQAKIAQDTDQAARGLLEIFNAWVYGRLGAENPTERVLAILDRWHRATYARLPATEGAAAGGVPVEAGDPAFPYAVYDEIVAAWRDKQVYDTGLLDRMLAVVAEIVDAAARRTPAAHHAAARLAAGEVPIEDALAAQDAVIDTLENVLETMRSWQSLNDLIIQLRRILEQQEALNERLQDSTRND